MFAAVVPVCGLVAATVKASTFWETLRRESVLDAVRFSFWQAGWSTVLTLGIGSCAAWMLARYEFVGRRFVTATLTIPFVLPTVVVGAAFLALFPSSIERGLVAIVLAHVFFNISVVVRLVAPVWSMLDPDVLAAARTLGASPVSVASRIVFPLARSAVASAGALVFLMTFTSYGIVRILGGHGSSTIEVEIYRRAVLFGDIPGATVLALVQTTIVIAIFARATRRSSAQLHSITPSRLPAPRWVPVLAVGLSAFVLVPLATMILSSVRVDGRWTALGWRSIVAGGTSVLPNTDIPSIVVRSLLYAVIASAVAVPTGIAAALALVRRRARWTRAVIVAPMATSAVVVGFGILVTYDVEPFDFRSRWWLIPVVHAVVALPFVVRSALPVIESIPFGLRHAAATLGASPRRRWLSVDLPLVSPAIATGCGLSAALSLGEFGATSFLTRRDSATLPIVVDQLLGRVGDTAFASSMAVATILLVLTSLIVIVFDSISRN